MSVVAVLGLILGPGGVPSELLRERCILAARLAKESPEAILIVSGGDTAGIGVIEATVMEKILIEYGVVKERIHLEEKAFDTPSNAINVLGMGRDLSGCGRVRLMLVTSLYHMPRSAWTFSVVAKAMGIDMVLEQHSSRWVEGHGDEKTMLLKEQRLLLKSQRLMKKFPNRRGMDFGDMEDIALAIKEVQEMIKDSVMD